MREEDGCDDVTVLNVMDIGHTAPSVSLGYLPIFIRSACRHAVCGQDHVWLSVHHTRISMEGQPIELRVGTEKASSGAAASRPYRRTTSFSR
jgi:hypothetical protein